jgi:threonine aldolase
MAALLEAALREIPEVRVLFPREANGVFAELPEQAIAALRAKGWLFYTFIGAGGCRFMCSWDTQPEDVQGLVADLRAALVPEETARA